MRCLLCLVLCCVVAHADWSDEQRRFRSAYRRAANARQKRAAIHQVARADRPEAAQLLFGLWDGLAQQTSKLRRELASGREKLRELRRREREPAGSEAKRKIQSRIQRAEAGDAALDKRLSGIEMERSAILAGLASMKSAAVIDWMARTGLGQARSPVLLRTIAFRIATAPDASVEVLLAALEKLRQPTRIVSILRTLGDRRAAAAPAVGPILRQLAHRVWPVRVAAAQALARIARPEGVEPLVQALAREKRRSRAQLEMARALVRLTGARIGPYPGLWQRWLEDHRGDLSSGRIKLGRGPKTLGAKQEQGHFYGIPQEAERIIYVFDKSGSMEVSMNHPRWEGKAIVPAGDDEDSRFDAAARELLRATKRLRRGSSYAVILYSSRARKLHDRLVPATPEEHAKLAQAMAHEGPDGSTNIYEALDLALRMAGVHASGTRGEQLADAIILLSDGSPTTPEGESEDPERTLQAVREWNAMQRIAIHCIGIGKRHNSTFLRRLAEENGGRYHAVLPPKRKKK